VTNPKVYLVYWGWGEPGAFPSSQTCSAETITEGSTTATLACDPDGAGKYMADFVSQMGGTQWAGVQTQYYQTDSSGNKTFISNPSNQLGGIWVDDTNDITGLPKTSSSNPPGSGNTYTDLAAEAARAVAHFGITDLHNSDIVIAQPPNYSDPNALSAGYCAFHDYTEPGLEGGIYNGIQQGIAYTNMPYSLAVNSGGVNVCGENAVNSGSQGKLDGFSIVLGHEIEETNTDPGAEDVIGSGTSAQQIGGWYDTVDANENGDKCAWVGENLLTGQGPPEPVFGAMGDITGNGGETFAVQSLWSNAANAGTGYCAGANTDSPLPSG
jgi:serine protease